MANANDGVSVSGGANVDIFGSELIGNFCNLAIDRGNVRWSRVTAEGHGEQMVDLSDAVGIRIAGMYSTLLPLPSSRPATPLKRETSHGMIKSPKFRRVIDFDIQVQDQQITIVT